MADTRHQGSKSRSLSNPITTLQDFLFSACLFIQSAIQSAGRQNDGSLLCLFKNIDIRDIKIWSTHVKNPALIGLHCQKKMILKLGG